MTELTADERTVLEIASHGESMMPIGRWEQPVEHLVELGFLDGPDRFNRYITDAGRKALEADVDKADDAFAKQLIALHNARIQYKEKMRRLTAELVEIVKEVVAVRGQTFRQTLSEILRAVEELALQSSDE